MDSVLNAAALSLAEGDALGALNRVALRTDAPALALRGIAMARLGDFSRAKVALKAAVRAFGSKEAVARARCAIAEAELALVSRDLAWPVRHLDQACAVLEAHGDVLNAAHARIVQARRQLLIGALDEAEAALAVLDETRLPPTLTAGRQLVLAGIALRRLQVELAREAIDRAQHAAALSGIGALHAEVEELRAMLSRPAARLVSRSAERPVRLDEVQALLRSGALVVDACRRVVWAGTSPIRFTTRPVLFAIVRALGEAWPADVARAALIEAAFRARSFDETYRARLRVEIGRLRAELGSTADVQATKRGFVLQPRVEGDVAVLAPPLDSEHAALLALMADGEAWSSSALALALGAGPRTIQRALEQLSRQAEVQGFGRGRARRWTVPAAPGFPSTLLLPGPFPTG
jgi:hypothetical protein